MKKVITILCLLLMQQFSAIAQIWPPGFCYNDAYQLNFTVTGPQTTCNDSLFVSTSSVGQPNDIFWSDGYVGPDRWITYSGVYYAYAYDSTFCIDTTEILYVSVNDVFAYPYTSNFQNSFCEGSSTTLNASYGGIITWNTGQTGTTISINAPGDYSFTSIDQNGCTITSDTITITEIPVPEITINIIGDTVFCQGGSVTLEATGGPNLWWNVGTNPAVITQSGTYFAYGYDSTGACYVQSENINVTALQPYTESLCIVSVDTLTSKNQLIWSPTPDQRIVSYNVYRESNVSGTYTLLGNVPFASAGLFTDLSGIPMQQAYTYYIASVDSCGAEDAYAFLYPHTTLHLTSSLGVNGENNLNWSPYITTFFVTSYDIYRSNNYGPFTSIATVSGSISSFSDLNPPAGNNRYFVGITSPNSCGNNGNSFARSNMVSNNTTGIAENEIRTWNVLSNPSKGLFEFNGLRDLTGDVITIYNALGEIVHRSTIQNDWTRIDLTNQAAGIYLANINGNTVRLIKE